MALRDQPYLPLYIKDFLSDEKLREASAESVGVYIMIMCVMHKSDEYGVILLSQKDKQKETTCLNFADKLARHLPFKIEVINKSIEELVSLSILKIEGDKLMQLRMVKDNSISIKRSASGKLGVFAKANHSAKEEANTAIAIVNENATENEVKILQQLDVVNPKIFEKIEKEILNSGIWIDDTARHYKVTVDFVNQKLHEFLGDVKLRGDEEKGLKEIKKHFINWFKLEIKKAVNGKSTFKTERQERNDQVTNLKEGSIEFLKRDRSQDH